MATTEDNVNTQIRDLVVQRQVRLLGYSRGVLRRMRAAVRRVEDDLLRKIEELRRGNLDVTWTLERLEMMLDEVQVLAAALYVVAERELVLEMLDLAEAELESVTQSIKRSLPVVLNVVTPSPQQVHAAAMAQPFQGRILSEWVRDLSAGQVKRMREAIRIGFIEGETVDQLVRRLRGTKRNGYRDGIFEGTRRGAEAVVRTAINHTATFARQALFEANEPLVKGVQWVATLDGRTSAVCRARDGKVYQLKKGPRPPAHPNCRSTLAPVLKSWRELGIPASDIDAAARASMNGQVAGAETYNTWLRRQPVDFVEEVLGKTKTKLYLDGNLSLDRFVDSSGREYSLDELRRREAEAFARAGVREAA